MDCPAHSEGPDQRSVSDNVSTNFFDPYDTTASASEKRDTWVNVGALPSQLRVIPSVCRRDGRPPSVTETIWTADLPWWGPPEGGLLIAFKLRVRCPVSVRTKIHSQRATACIVVRERSLILQKTSVVPGTKAQPSAVAYRTDGQLHENRLCPEAG